MGKLTGAAALPVLPLMDERGRIIRSPEVEADIAKLTARITDHERILAEVNMARSGERLDGESPANTIERLRAQRDQLRADVARLTAALEEATSNLEAVLADNADARQLVSDILAEVEHSSKWTHDSTGWEEDETLGPLWKTLRARAAGRG